jgi:hypothetical protein
MPLPPIPAWTPQRSQPENHQPGNPLYNPPGMQHPYWNAGGLLPGTIPPRGPDAWCSTESQNFRSDGTNQTWTFSTPVFDLRPGLSVAYGNIPAATPINRDASYGLNTYLVLIIGTRGGAPPSLVAGMEAHYWEDGNCVQADNPQILRLTKIIDVTTILQAGGDRIVDPDRGASPFSFTPCVQGLRHWRLNLRLTIAGVAPITAPLFIQAAL